MRPTTSDTVEQRRPKKAAEKILHGIVVEERMIRVPISSNTIILARRLFAASCEALNG